MPARKKYAKKPRAKRVYKKKQYKSRMVMINSMPKRVHTLVAPIFFTTMQAQIQARLPIGVASTGHFYVYASKLFEPFNNPTAPLSAIATGLGAIALDNVQPAGILAIANLYENYRVHKCTMRTTFTPRINADQILLVVLPQDQDTTSVTTAQQALSQPYSKTITCTGTNNIKQNTMHMGIKNRTYFGRTKQSYRAENEYACFGSITGSQPVLNMYYDTWYETYSGAVTTADININIVLTYSVEFFEPKTELAV